MICLDTNILIGAINRRVPQIRQRLIEALMDGQAVGVPVIVLFEMWFGIKKSARPQKNAENLSDFLMLGVTPWPFDSEDAREAGEIRAALAKVGTPIGPYDVLIAAQARRRSAILVTTNTREFARVPGLRVEDWSA